MAAAPASPTRSSKRRSRAGRWRPVVQPAVRRAGRRTLRARDAAPGAAGRAGAAVSRRADGARDARPSDSIAAGRSGQDDGRARQARPAQKPQARKDRHDPRHLHAAGPSRAGGDDGADCPRRHRPPHPRPFRVPAAHGSRHLDGGRRRGPVRAASGGRDPHRPSRRHRHLVAPASVLRPAGQYDRSGAPRLRPPGVRPRLPRHVAVHDRALGERRQPRRRGEPQALATRDRQGNRPRHPAHADHQLAPRTPSASAPKARGR